MLCMKHVFSAQNRLLGILLVAFVMLSCSPSEYDRLIEEYGDRLVGLDSWADSQNSDGVKSLRQRTSALVSAIESHGLPTPATPINVLLSSERGIGFRLWSDDDEGTTWSASSTIHHSADSFSAAVAELKSVGSDFMVEELYHLRPWIAGFSPLCERAISWNDATLAIWLVTEGIGGIQSRHMPSDGRLVEYWAHKAAEEVLITLKGRGSLELDQFRGRVRDEITWAALTPPPPL